MADCPRVEYRDLRAKTDFLTWSERNDIRKAVFDRDPPLCVWCHRKLGDHRSAAYYQADHIVPRADGGAYAKDNLALSCKSCNSERGSRGIIQYLLHRAAA